MEELSPSRRRAFGTLDHICGLPGFGESPYDICPACECSRLMARGVPREIALAVAHLRWLFNPNELHPRINEMIREELTELERQYGKKLP